MTLTMLVRMARNYAREARKCQLEANRVSLYRCSKQYLELARDLKR